MFQPAEEGGGGARAMLDDGLIGRFGIERAYGLHISNILPSGICETTWIFLLPCSPGGNLGTVSPVAPDIGC